MEEKKEMRPKIKCTNCGKEIEQKGTRTVCIRCRNIMDKIRIAERTHTQEFKDAQREKYRLRKEGII